jgi:hypothetical protein
MPCRPKNFSWNHREVSLKKSIRLDDAELKRAAAHHPEVISALPA